MNAPFAIRDDATLSNAHEYTVSELSRSVKRSIEDGFGQVRVRGEIGNFRGRHSSGHAYFSLKDADACLDAVVWRSAYGKLGIPPEEGLEVVATGRMTTFAKKSSYQLVVEGLEPAGVGALMKLLEERRKKLAAEGLFDEARKRPLPALPQLIGVVTSPTGAVIRDILHRVADRFPVRVVVWPVRVQGETSGAEVAAAIEGFAKGYGGPRPDVVIVARGGGSVEDLWGYNDEVLVRAVAASPIPIVSAVGHETDWTLIDHAADVRAPTPTGAAEMVVPVRADCVAALTGRAQRLDLAMVNALRGRTDTLRHLARGLPAAAALLDGPRQRADMAADKLTGALAMATARARQRYLSVAGLLAPRVALRSLEQGAERTEAAFARLGRAVDRRHADCEAAVERVGKRLRPELLRRRIEEADTGLQRLAVRRERAVAARLGDAAATLAGLSKLLCAVSYQAVLSRGFALVRRQDETPVRTAAEVRRGETLQVEFADDRLSVVEASSARKVARAAVRAVRRSKRQDEAQGDLF